MPPQFELNWVIEKLSSRPKPKSRKSERRMFGIREVLRDVLRKSKAEALQNTEPECLKRACS